ERCARFFISLRLRSPRQLTSITLCSFPFRWTQGAAQERERLCPGQAGSAENRMEHRNESPLDLDPRVTSGACERPAFESILALWRDATKNRRFVESHASGCEALLNAPFLQKKFRSLSIGEVLCVFAVVKRIPRLA